MDNKMKNKKYHSVRSKVRRYQREVIRSRKSKKNRQHNGQKIPKGGNQKPKVKEGQPTQWSKDTKGVIRSRKSKKDRQYNG